MMEIYLLPMHGRIYLLIAVIPRTTLCRVLQHISLHHHRNMAQNLIDDHITPSFIQRIEPTFLFEK